MIRFSFKDDYSEGAHPKVLENIMKDNLKQQPGYGLDEFSEHAKKLIRQEIKSPQSEIHLVGGGTQANLLVISSLLKPYEAVISADSGHINVNETGAIEAVGHKVISCENKEGKLTSESVLETLSLHSHNEHKVKPKLLYISNATELGSVYSLEEIKGLHQICKEHQLFLFMDGARLAQALQSTYNDITLAQIAQLTDVFYFGGTKNGALFGEAIVINTPEIQPFFRYNMKQKGALLAKGRSLGLQFEALFTDSLYKELALHANTMATLVSEGFQKKNFPLLLPTYTNQVFPILDNEKIKSLQNYFDFHIWKKIDETHSAIRLVCSWATPEMEVNRLISTI